MDNTEGTPADGDSVETTRGASDDWSNVAEEYARLGKIRLVAELHGAGYKKARNELLRHGVTLNPKGIPKGAKRSESWRKASEKHWNDPVWRDKQRQQWIKRLPTINGRAANSPLEKLLHRALLKAGISFSTQQCKLGKYLVDIELRQAPIVIEADGSRHYQKRNQEKDALRDRDLAGIGYTVYRFNGTQINADPDACIQKVIEGCGLTPDTEPVAIIADVRGRNHPSFQDGRGSIESEYTCERCGNLFMAIPTQRDNKHKFCNKTCQIDWLQHDPEMVKRRAEGKKRQRERTQQRQMVI